ncbi:hypothetical protein HDU96_009646 [Phlyctochytrium bullatum]|nr:hypothetical protein HDU96_009646 [Phlyctochytrium bullatum]
MSEVPISSFVSEYVRSLSEEHRARIVSALMKGEPYSENTWAAVLMVDISGYSTVTSKLAAYGKISSELITNSVKSYMTKIIEVAVRFGGDVVKFLGDAVIISFISKTKKCQPEAMLRAFKCAISTLHYFPHESIDIDALNNYKQNLGNLTRRDSITQQKAPAAAQSKPNTQQRRQSLVSEDSNARIDESKRALRMSRQQDDFDCHLKLHIALVAGDGQNIILGLPDKRMDYTMHCGCFHYLNGLVGSAHSGEIAVQSTVWQTLVNELHVRRVQVPPTLDVEDGVVLPTSSVAEIASYFTGHEEEASERQRKPSSLPHMELDAKTRDFVSNFINESIVFQFKNVASTEAISKYLSGQYRTITAMFIKIKSDFDPLVAQQAVTTFISVLKANNGVFQQFAGDVVNIAARLLGIADHENPIICDDATASVTQRFCKSFLGYFTLKGISERVATWSVSADAPLPNKRSAYDMMVGYVEERGKLLDAITRWIHSREMTISIVEGPSGMGKTTFSDFFLKEMQQREITFFVTSAAKENMIVPFSGIRKLILWLLSEYDLQSSINNGRGGRLGSRCNSHLSGLSVSILGDKKETVTAQGVARFLAHAHENPELAPLFSTIFPGEGFDDNATTRIMEPIAKKMTQVGILSRIIVKDLVQRRVALVFDDVQWLDSASLEVLTNLTKSKSQIFLFLCSRPMQDKGLAELRAIAIENDAVHISLDGFKHKDVEELLVASLAHLGKIRHVDPGVSEALVNRASQIPNVLRLMIDTMVDRGSFELDDDTLRFCGNEDDFNAEWFESLKKSAVIMQFDKLNINFQNFLQHASIFGQYFDVSDVCALMNDGDDEDDLMNLIAAEDTFSFLKSNVDAALGLASFSFRHITIANTIYESISYSKRSTLHSELGSILERKLAPDNRSFLLPLIYHHYSQTSQVVDKRLSYSEELGLFYLSQSYMLEAMAVLRSLVEFAESLEELPAPFDDPVRRASWYCSLAKASSVCIVVDVAISSSCSALRLLGMEFPEPEDYIPKMTERALMRQLKLFLLTRGGRSRWLKNADRTLIERQVLRDYALGSIFDCTIFQTEISSGYKTLVVVELLNQSIIVANEKPSVWARRSICFAFVFLLSQPWVCRLYFNAGCVAWSRAPVEEVAKDFDLYWLILWSLYREDKRFLNRLLQTYAPVFNRQGDSYRKQMIVNYTILVNMPMDIEFVRESILPNLSELWSLTMLGSVNTAVILMMLSLYGNRLDIVKSCLAVLEQNIERVQRNTATSTNFFETGRLMAQIWFAVLSKDYMDALESLEQLADLSTTMSLFSPDTPATTTGFLAMWPIFVASKHFHAEERTRVVSQSLGIAAKLRPLFLKSRHLITEAPAIYLLDGLVAWMKGKTGTSRRVLRRLVNRMPVDDVPGFQMHQVGLGWTGLWLLDGHTGDLLTALEVLEKAKAFLFIEWIKELRGL